MGNDSFSNISFIRYTIDIQYTFKIMSIHFNRQAERSRRRSYKTIIFKEGGIILLIFLILFIILKKKFTRITKKQVNYTLEEIISIPASIERNARRTRKKKRKR